jgi:hypothetical protein
LNVHIATLAVLATLLLGMARQSIALPVVVAVAAAASLWLTDVTGRFRLRPAAVNAGVFVTAAVLWWRLARSRFAVDLLAVGDVLVWVQILLLLEEKSRRTWWDLVSLSLVQVFLAGLANQGPLFGLVLVAYLFFALSALVLLLLDRERTADHRAGATLGGTDPSPDSGAGARFCWSRLGKLALATLAVGPLSLFLRYREPTHDTRKVARGRDPSPHPRQVPGRREKPVFAVSRDSVRDTPEVGHELWGRVTGMTLTSLLVSLVVFCTVPRFGRVDLMFPRFGQVDWGAANPRRSVGFSDRVALGELGTIIENPEQVLEVRFVDDRTGQRYPVEGDVFLRGAVLTRYVDGGWEHGGSRGDFRLLRPGVRPPGGPLVRQEITIEPMDRQEVFCVWPFVVTEENEHLRFDAGRERLRRSKTMRQRRFSFELGTTAFVEGTQADLVPSRGPVDARSLLGWPSDSLPRLTALARGWIAESGIPADDPLDRARYLERRLRESERFVYSLEGPMRDAALDPIEDFVVNNPQGHCEYFATALTLMLRSQEIPARLVVGYKCGEYGYVSQAYRVRQSHAHTWVEAHVAPEEVSLAAREGRRFADWSHGGWLRLDPTPVAPGGVAMVGIVEEVESWFQWLRSVWQRDVLGMTQTRQHELIYGPLASGAQAAVRSLADPDWWRGVLQDAGRGLAALARTAWQGKRLAWRVGLLVATAAAGLVLGYCGYRLLLRRPGWSFFGWAGARKGGQRSKVPFYRRLEAVLAQHGLRRPAAQTQREFAREAGARIGASTGQSQLVHLPAEVAEAFYQVRFGGRRLDPRQSAAVNEALTRLERAHDGSQDGRPATARGKSGLSSLVGRVLHGKGPW